MKNDSPFDPTNICKPTILAITRITNENISPKNDKTAEYIKYIVQGVKPGYPCYFWRSKQIKSSIDG